MRAVIVDERIDTEIESALRGFGYEIFKLPGSRCLQVPVSAHPDMLVFICKDKLFCHGKYYSEANGVVDAIADAGSLELILSNEMWESAYPNDVLFNAALI